MVIVWQIFVFQCVDNSEICLDSTAILILKDFDSFIFKPVLHFSIFMERDSRLVSLSRIGYPIDTIFRALIKSDTSQPIIHNQVVLNVVTPDNRVFKLPFYRRISPLIGNLVVRRKPGLADPYTTSTANHQIGTVFPLSESQVGKTFYDTAVGFIKIKLLTSPRTVQAIGNIISVDYINNNTSVF